MLCGSPLTISALSATAAGTASRLVLSTNTGLPYGHSPNASTVSKVLRPITIASTPERNSAKP